MSTPTSPNLVDLLSWPNTAPPVATPATASTGVPPSASPQTRGTPQVTSASAIDDLRRVESATSALNDDAANVSETLDLQDDALSTSRGPVFNYQEFLAKMRNPSAYDLVQPAKEFVAQYKKPITNVEEVVPVVRRFLDNMDAKFRVHPLWKTASETDFEHASEGMEKYVTSKLYRYLFQPETSDENMRDQALAHRMQMLSFIRPEHLDISPACAAQVGSLADAQTELFRMDSFKAPRDKMICVLRCARHLNTVLKAAGPEGGRGADEYLPLLIYAILQAAPPNLYSNLHFVLRFRNPDRLRGEGDYYLTQLQSAIVFIETVDSSRLNIDPQEFDRELNKSLEKLDQELKVPAPAAASPHRSSAGSQSQAATAAAQAEQDLRRPTRPPPPRPGDDERSRTNTISTSWADHSRWFGGSDKNAGQAASKSAASSAPRQPPPQQQQQRQPQMHLLDAPNTTFTQASSTESLPHVGVGDHDRATFTAGSTAPSTAAQSKRSSRLDITTILPAAAEKPIERFLHATPEELRIGDVAVLLADYKRLAKLNSDLLETLSLNLSV